MVVTVNIVSEQTDQVRAWSLAKRCDDPLEPAPTGRTVEMEIAQDQQVQPLQDSGKVRE
jgi:hypothetical protein